MNRKFAALFCSATIVACLVSFTGCEKPAPPPPPAPAPPPTAVAPKATPVSAEKNSFADVTAHLDPGGSLYLYLSTEQWFDGLSGKLAQWRGLLDAAPGIEADDRSKINLAFDIGTRLVKNCGVEEISGVGISSIAREPGYYHSKFILHHYRGRNTGYVWSMFGKSQHILDSLNLLPATTAAASSFELDSSLIWSIIEKEVKQAGIPEATDAIAQGPAGFEAMTGLKLDDTLASLAGEFTLALTLDESKKVSLPLGDGAPLEIPEPGILIFVKVKNDLIFDAVDRQLAAMPGLVKTDDKGVRMRVMPLPIPLPMVVRPTVARAGDYLFIASSDALVREALAVKAGEKKGLKSTSEFQKLAKEVPEKGNHILFVSQKLGSAVQQIQKTAMKELGGAGGGFESAIQKMAMANQQGYTYAVSANTDEGWIMTANGNLNSPAMMMGPAVAFPVGMLAAIAIPNFVKARTTAQKNACIANLKQLDGATQQWALENKMTTTSKVDPEGIKIYLKGNRLPNCPQGGTYTFSTVGETPHCSIPGHKID